MSESKFNTTQYQNVIGGGTEKWINMSYDERQKLREGIATSLNIGLTFSPVGGGAKGIYNIFKVIGGTIKNPKNAWALTKSLLSTGKNYATNPTNIGKKSLQKGVFTGIDTASKIENTEVKLNKTSTRNFNPLNAPENAP